MNKKKYFFIIAFFIVIGIILLFSLKKDEIVNNKKTIYYVTLKGKGFDINQTLSCFTYSNKCKVKLPLPKAFESPNDISTEEQIKEKISKIVSPA